MMRTLIVMALLLPALMVAQQEPRDVNYLDEEKLIEAVYYHDNGEVSQKGTFNLQGELHGTWISYDEAGNKVAMGNYENGRKNGKWFFWGAETLKEVDYDQNTIASVQEWKGASRLAVNR